MESKKKILIVIPIYKVELTFYECISLQQGVTVFEEYEILFIAPKYLDVSYYKKRFPKIGYEFFDDIYFRNVHGYNKLLLNISFYRTFACYNYMLVYQLDGFVFSDRLADFMSLNYDYIGAPWISGRFCYKHLFKGAGLLNRMLPFFNRPEKLHVGNGGVSLRKISTTIDSLERFANMLPGWKDSEDIFFSYIGKKHPQLFHVAPMDIAVQFSFETELEKCWQMTKGKLPFACHAWQKYNLEFWRPIFKMYGFTI